MHKNMHYCFLYYFVCYVNLFKELFLVVPKRIVNDSFRKSECKGIEFRTKHQTLTRKK